MSSENSKIPMLRVSYLGDHKHTNRHETIIDGLNNNWMNRNVHVTGLVGSNGDERRDVVNSWLGRMGTSKFPGKRPYLVFWWTFKGKSPLEIDSFLEAALTWMGGATMAHQMKNPIPSIELIGTMIRHHRYLFILDGVDVFQYKSRERRGDIGDDAMKLLIDYFLADGHNSHCVLTSDTDFLGYSPYTSYKHQSVKGV